MSLPNASLQFISTSDSVLGTNDPLIPNGALNRELYKLLQNDLALEEGLGFQLLSEDDFTATIQVSTARIAAEDDFTVTLNLF